MTERRDDAEERQGPVIRDKRRIDPTTGEPRAADAKGEVGEPAETPAPGPTGGEELAKAREALAERTTDLQRLQAEYANYRKRVERDRVAVKEAALANVVSELLPVLDDIGRARDHGELTGGFKQVAERLEAAVGKLGLQSFGEAGEPFDPTVHEALTHAYSADVTEPTAVQIFQPGYSVAGRVVRPARVAVAEPSAEAPEAPETPEKTETRETSETPETHATRGTPKGSPKSADGSGPAEAGGSGEPKEAKGSERQPGRRSERPGGSGEK